MADLGIVIVSWNVRELLAACLESVISDRWSVTREITVVDNASTDGSAEMVRNRFPQARLIASEKNLGFAGGSNLGCAPGIGCSTPRAPAQPRYVVRGDALETLVRLWTPLAGGLVRRGGWCMPTGAFSIARSAFRACADRARCAWRPSAPERLALNGRYSRKLYGAGKPFEIDHPLGARCWHAQRPSARWA